MGYKTTPAFDDDRNDIITSIETGSPEGLCAVCQGVQAGSPVDSFVTPEPYAMPGYEDQVIMAAGAFTMGSSIELSCDCLLYTSQARCLFISTLIAASRVWSS